MRSKFWIVLIGPMLLGACGKSKGSSAVPQGEFPTRVGNLLCDSLAACCQSSGFAIDVSACKKAYVTRLNETLGNLDPQKVEYDAQAAGDCLDVVQSFLHCGELDDEDVPACENILRGKVRPGQPCTESNECQQIAGQPRVRCVSQNELATRICASEPSVMLSHGKAGDSCITTCFEGEDCASVVTSPTPNPDDGDVPTPMAKPVACFRDEGLFCDQGRCSPTLAVGLACPDYAACSGTAFCDFATQRCAAPRADGASCEADAQCQSGNCADPAPSADGAPGPQFCVNASGVTAAQCGQDFDAEEPPAQTPAPSAGAAPSPGAQ